MASLTCTRGLMIALALCLPTGAFGQETKSPPKQRQDETFPLLPDEALKSIQIRPGFRLELVASEPMTKDPVAIDWDIHGRLWVAEMADYPLGIDGKGKPGGRVRVLEDSNQDGRYDKSTVFLDELSFPNGIITWRDGALITAAPDILYAVDHDGDGRADTRDVLFTGFNPGNQQLRMNGLRWGLDNWIYCASGSHHAGYGADTGVTSVATGERVVLGSRDFRIRPDEHLIDPQSGPSQFGRNRDDWGNWFGVQNSFPLWHYVLADHYLRRNPYYVPPNPRRDLTEPNPTLYPIKTQKRFHSFEHSTRFTSACSGNIYRDTFLFGESSPQDSLQHSFTCAPFHSLVQHNLVRKDGTSFQLTRDPAEEKTEFFASSDRWCRPVMVRTGPDGALWIVDMYRYMIEHPEWVNEAARDELRPYYRHGEEQGRIYRVFPLGEVGKRRVVPHLADLTVGQLVDKLTDTNGWVRDKCQQLLLWKADESALEPLRRLATKSEYPWARLHALCTLDGLDALNELTLLAALSDEHAGVRRHAIRLAEKRGSPRVLDALPPLVQDSDPQVRLQLASSLGEFDDPRLGIVLAQLLTDPRNDTYIQAAAMSSLSKRNVGVVLSEVLSSETLSQNVLRGLARITVQSNRQGLASLVEAIANAEDQSPHWRFDALAALLDVTPLDELSSLADVAGVKAILSDANAVARDDRADAALRLAAIQLIGRKPTFDEAAIDATRQLLSPRESPPIQAATVSRLSNRAEPSVAMELLQRWRNHGPTLRGQIVNVLLSRESWTAILLDAMESKRVLSSDLDAVTRQRLLSLKASELRRRAESLLAGSSTADRQTVVEEYQAALRLPADFTAGKKVFDAKCANCHSLVDNSPQIGPNLAAVTDKSPQALLTSILDPNRAVEAKFLSYTVADSDGRTHSGLIKTETATSITLVTIEAKEISILRSDIEELTSTGKSLMPDGLERELSIQDMADLVEYVRLQN